MRGFLPILLLLLMQPAQTTALYEYAAACIPRYEASFPATCQLHILSDVESDIEIQTFSSTDTFTLPAGTPYQKDFGEEFIPTIDSESKAIRVTSTAEIQVLVHVTLLSSNRLQDAYMVPNSIRSNNIYYTSAYFRNDAIQCSYNRYKQFYLVSSIYDETTISVTQQDGSTYDLELPSFGTFLQKTDDENNHLAMGTRITSNKPITVVAGNLCVVNTVSGTVYADVFLSSFPEVASLGEKYVIPHIISEDVDNPAGFSVGVVATEDNTTAISDGEMRSLNQGETAIFEYPFQETSIYVNCSKPCLVVQYTKAIRNEYGLFMQNILPKQQFSTSAFFTTMNSHPASFLSLVVEGEAPGDDVFLDGTSLGYLVWMVVNGYSSAELEIPQGAHELLSINGRPFAAYVYSQQLLDDDAASGYALLPLESSRITPAPTTSPTTQSPSVNGTLPQHTVRVNGTALAEDGQDIPGACAVAHLNNLIQKAANMMVPVNAAIGTTICLHASDILVVSTSAATFTINDKILLDVYHMLRVQGHHVPDDVESCALEIADYLKDLSSWQQPIFPDEPGCSRLEIVPPYFNTSGIFWVCDNQQDPDVAVMADNFLSYTSEVMELFHTTDGNDLNADCTRLYNIEAALKTSSMRGHISAALVSSACDDVVTSVTHAQSFAGQGNQAYFQAFFYYVPSRSASFAGFVACMQQVHNFSLLHQNWSPGSQPGAPFLPSPAGCPALEHDTESLDDGGQQWTWV